METRDKLIRNWDLVCVISTESTTFAFKGVIVSMWNLALFYYELVLLILLFEVVMSWFSFEVALVKFDLVVAFEIGELGHGNNGFHCCVEFSSEAKVLIKIIEAYLNP
jgi:hypothetical protein